MLYFAVFAVPEQRPWAVGELFRKHLQTDGLRTFRRSLDAIQYASSLTKFDSVTIALVKKTRRKGKDPLVIVHICATKIAGRIVLDLTPGEDRHPSMPAMIAQLRQDLLLHAGRT